MNWANYYPPKEHIDKSVQAGGAYEVGFDKKQGALSSNNHPSTKARPHSTAFPKKTQFEKNIDFQNMP